MKLSEVVFYKSVSLWLKEVVFDERKEIIFVWRSNVWKSSIMNSLFGKKDLVKTSARPGKTKTANLFLVENKYYFTDLPGYWFARLGKEYRDQLDWLISWYIDERKEFIKKIVILIDSKIWAQESDISMYKYLSEMNLPVCIVLSKIDKFKKNEVNKILTKTKNDFYWQDIFSVSSLKKIWIWELGKYLRKSLISHI